MENKTVALRTALKAKLNVVCQRVYYDQAPATASFPYIVFSIAELSTDDATTLCELEVNVLDYGSDTSTCENMTDAVQTEFDFYVHTESPVFQTYKERRHPVQEEDKKTIRRRMTFTLRLHEGG